MSKYLEKHFFDFGSKNYADQCILVSGVRENSFFRPKTNFKNFQFLDLENFQNFLKNL